MKMLTRMLSMLLLFPTCSPAGTVKIQGRVVFEPTQEPLKDVVVHLIRPDRTLAARLRTGGTEGTPKELGVTKTDAYGNFSFETTSQGPYEIMCFRAGGHIASGNSNVDPKQFVVIQYKPDPVPNVVHPGQKP